ncbi:MAG: hypothetical protein U0736_22740 [Gemmataceae bacterium]
MQPGPPSPRLCVVLVVRLAADRVDAARRLISGILTGLAALAHRGALEPVQVDVAVLSAAGAQLPDTSADRPFRSLSEAAALPVGRLDTEGDGAAALASVAAAVQGWLLRQDHPLRPLVVYLTDEDGIDAVADLPGRLLRHLTVPAGPLLLATCGFPAERGRVVPMPSRKDDVPESAWRTAWAACSRGHTAAGEETHAARSTTRRRRR